MNSEIAEMGPATAVYPHTYNVKHDDDPDYRGTVVKQLSADKVVIGNHDYQLVYNYQNGFDPERLGQRFEAILNKYDYVVGDWGFEQLRLRGFYGEQNHSANRDQIITTLEDYLADFCNFGCAFFVLQREGAPSKSRASHPQENHGGGERRRRHRDNNRRKPSAEQHGGQNQSRQSSKAKGKNQSTPTNHAATQGKNRPNSKNKATDNNSRSQHNRRSNHRSHHSQADTQQAQPVTRSSQTQSQRSSRVTTGQNKTSSPATHATKRGSSAGKHRRQQSREQSASKQQPQTATTKTTVTAAQKATPAKHARPHHFITRQRTTHNDPQQQATETAAKASTQDAKGHPFRIRHVNTK